MKNMTVEQLTATDIKYRGPLSVLGIRIFGFLFLFFAQILLIYSAVSTLTDDIPKSIDKIAQVLQFLTPMSTTLFMLAAFSRIMADETKVLKTMAFYFIVAISIWLGFTLLFERYIVGILSALLESREAAHEVASLIVSELVGSLLINNVFVDLFLFSTFYFFFVYTPKKLTGRKVIALFRLCTLFPAAVTVFGSLVPSLFAVAIFIKVRKHVFLKKGATSEQYIEFCKTNRCSLQYSIFTSIMYAALTVAQFIIALLITKYDWAVAATSFTSLLIIPFVMLFSYNRPLKAKMLNTALPVIFIAMVVILYLESFLFFMNHLDWFFPV